MKFVGLLASAILVAAAPITAVQAGHGPDDGPRRHLGFTTSAKVVDVIPIRRDVRVSDPQRVCRTERVVREEHHKKSSTGAVIAGGIIGGAIGNQLGGSKRGRRQGRVGGAIIGGIIGKNIHDKNNPGHTHRYVERRRVCRRVNDYYVERRTVGYKVIWRYQGRRFVSRTDRPPRGRRIRVRVSLDPAL
jgi:uncharacterized protein YcfJ